MRYAGALMIGTLVATTVAVPAVAKGGGKPATKTAAQPGTVIVVAKRAPRAQQKLVFASVASVLSAGGIMAASGSAAPAVRSASPQ